MRASCADMLHFPRTSLISIGARCECTDRANINTHAAFFALEVILFIRRDNRAGVAVLYAECPNIHPLAAHAHAPITKDAPRAVEVHDRRPLLLLAMVLDLDKFRLVRA